MRLRIPLADSSLTVYDKTQGVLNTQQYVTGVFGLKPECGDYFR